MTEQSPLDSAELKQEINSHDVILWPDGTWCYRSELHEYTHMSDDFRVVPYLNAEWMQITDQVPYE